MKFNPYTGQFETTGKAGKDGYVFDTAKAQGNITALNQALVAPGGGNAGVWYVSTVTGTLTGTNAGSLDVVNGDYVVSNGTAYVKVSAQNTASNAPAASTAAPITTNVNLESFTFTRDEVLPWFGFLDENCITADNTWLNQSRASVINTFNASTMTIGSGVLQLSGPNGSGWALQLGAQAPIMPFFGIEAQLIQSTGGTSTDFLRVGYRQWGANRWVYAVYDQVNQRVRVSYSNGASGDLPSSPSWVTVPSQPFAIGLGVADKCAAVWIKQTSTSQWDYVQTVAIPVATLDLRDPAVLATMVPQIEGTWSGGSGRAFQIGQIRTGLLKGIGLANPSMAKWADGPIWQDDTKVFFIANKAHPAVTGSTGQSQWWSIGANNCAILSYDVTTAEIQTVSNLAFLRAGRIYGDNSGCIVFDPTNQRYELLVSNWGDFGDPAYAGTDIYRYTLNRLPRGGAVLTADSVLGVGGTLTNWDPSIALINSTWYVVMSESNLRNGWTASAPKVVSGSSLSSLTAIWTADKTGVQFEGSKILKVNGTWRVAASNNINDTWSVFNLTTGAAVATGLTQPYGSQQATDHPNLFPWPEGNRTRWIWLGFNNDKAKSTDGTYTWGAIQTATVNELTTGHEYAARRVPWA